MAALAVPPVLVLLRVQAGAPLELCRGNAAHDSLHLWAFWKYSFKDSCMICILLKQFVVAAVKWEDSSSLCRAPFQIHLEDCVYCIYCLLDKVWFQSLSLPSVSWSYYPPFKEQRWISLIYRFCLNSSLFIRFYCSWFSFVAVMSDPA